MSKNNKGQPKPTHDEIAARAQKIYETEGRPQGKATEHWLRAESQLLAERKAGPAAKAPGREVAPAWQATSGRQNLHQN